MHGDQQNQFLMDGSSGLISVGKVLDREMVASYGELAVSCNNLVRGNYIKYYFISPTNLTTRTNKLFNLWSLLLLTILFS